MRSAVHLQRVRTLHAGERLYGAPAGVPAAPALHRPALPEGGGVAHAGGGGRRAHAV